MPLNNSQFREKLQAWRLEAMSLSEELRAMDDAHREQLTQLQTELKRAWSHLSALYIPDFTSASLARAAQWTGFSALASNQPFQDQLEDGKASHQRLKVISQDERFLRAHALLRPEVGPLALRLAEANSFLAPWLATVENYQRNHIFMRLFHAGYSTPSYLYKWWHPHYYRDWREGDELVEAAGKKDWSELATEYTQAKRETDRWSAVKLQVEEEMKGIIDLVEEHRALSIRVNSLDDVHRDIWREKLIEHIQGLAPAVMHQLSQSESIREQLALISGLTAKIRYMEALRERRLDADRMAVDKALAKANQTINKTFRSKNASRSWADHEVAAATPSLRDRLAPKWEKHQTTVRTLLDFTAYTAVDLATDFLWWDVITDGRLDGDFIPEVQQYRRVHPTPPQGAGGEEEEDADLGSALHPSGGSAALDSSWDAS